MIIVDHVEEPAKVDITLEKSFMGDTIKVGRKQNFCDKIA